MSPTNRNIFQILWTTWLGNDMLFDIDTMLYYRYYDTLIVQRNTHELYEIIL